MRGYFVLIQPDQIRKMKRPEFGRHGRRTLQEYRDELERFQPWFHEYEETETIKDFEELEKNASIFLIGKDRKEREKEFEKWRTRGVFENNYLDADKISVIRHRDGTYSVLTNGRHRLYTAGKYHLPVLAWVAEEEF